MNSFSLISTNFSANDDPQIGSRLSKIKRVLLVGSGKGGVGKSLVASGLAIVLTQDGFKTGLLDLDLHGASVPIYLDVRPPLTSGSNGFLPKKVKGLKVMSTALFTGDNPVSLREGRKAKLVKLLFSMTDWGELDFLVVDLPPSTGDEVLSAFQLFRDKCSLLLVTTPSTVATSIVRRLRVLANSEDVNVSGIIVNMAYLKQGKRKIKVFGKNGGADIERKLSARLLAEIPVDPQINNNTRGLKVVLGNRSDVSRAFKKIAGEIIKEA